MSQHKLPLHEPDKTLPLHSPSTPAQERPYFEEDGFFQARVVSSDARHAVTLKPLSAQLRAFFVRFESSCSLDCCGLSALTFPLPSEWDKRWRPNRDVQKALLLWREEVVDLQSEVVTLSEFGRSLYRDDLVFLIDHLLEGIKQGEQYT